MKRDLVKSLSQNTTQLAFSAQTLASFNLLPSDQTVEFSLTLR